MCKFKRKQYKAHLIDQLNNLFENDPKAYWSLLNELKENKTTMTETMTSSDEMFDHFSNLDTLPSKFHQRANELEEQLNQAESSQPFNKLDFSITETEVTKCLQALKNGKSSGLDCICNEMLK